MEEPADTLERYSAAIITLHAAAIHGVDSQSRPAFNHDTLDSFVQTGHLEARDGDSVFGAACEGEVGRKTSGRRMKLSGHIKQDRGDVILKSTRHCVDILLCGCRFKSSSFVFFCAVGHE
jgi:hypothetical protein